MNHEIQVPENQMIGRKTSELAMPGQQRIPKDIAISKHIAQFWSEGMSRAAERRARDESIRDWRTAINRARSEKKLNILKAEIRKWYIYGQAEGPAAVQLTDLVDTRLARMSKRKVKKKRRR